MTASWEPTSRASVQGRSSSLRNILGSGLRRERGEFWGQAGEEQASREIISYEPRWCQELRGKDAKSKGHRREHTGVQSCTEKKQNVTTSSPTTCHFQPKFHSPPPPLQTTQANYSQSPPPRMLTSFRSFSKESLENLPPNFREGWTHLGSSCLLRDHGDFRGSRGGRAVRHYLKLEMSQRTEKGSIQHSNSDPGTSWNRSGQG